MFETIRQSKIVMIFLLGLLVIAFVFVGVSGYSSFNDKSPTVAELDGAVITQAQWDQAHEAEIQNLRESMPQLDVKLLDTPEARYATLERLLQDELVAASVRKLRVVAGDSAVQRALRDDPWLNARRDASGNLDVAQVREELAIRGMTDESYAAQMAYALAQAQVAQGVQATGLALSAAAKATLDAYFERRQIQVALFDARQFTESVKVTDADVQTFYDDNKANFLAPETVDVAYLVLDQADIAKAIEINEADLKAYYEQNKSRLSGPEERRASHILLTLDAGASADAVKAAEEKAKELLARVKGDPTQFAQLAKENSQDPGSAQNGGDLGFFGPGAMVQAFNDAVFAMKKGEISDIVRTDFGLHIIQLTDVKSAEIKPYEAMRASILDDLRGSQAARKFAEVAESFSNVVYEQADSLEPAAKRLGLTIQTAKAVSRQGPSNAADNAIWGNAKLREAVFANDAIQKKLNTAAIDIGSSRLVAARVTAHQPARTRDLAEVKTRVQALLTAQKAAALAVSTGQDALTKWRVGSTAPVANVRLGQSVSVSRDQAGELSPNLIAAALRVDAKQLPAWTTVDQGLQGFAVIKVTAVEKRPAPEATQAAQEVQQFTQAWSSAELNAYLASLKVRFNSKILVPKPSATANVAR
ncbi:peptidylprolyl isomerase [Betaproteobacteria bacterium LSUCC0117]|nr:peptidylprolyl isomerase [Betaproteobacteria bacterium LSUCC0117]